MSRLTCTTSLLLTTFLFYSVPLLSFEHYTLPARFETERLIFRKGTPDDKQYLIAMLSEDTIKKMYFIDSTDEYIKQRVDTICSTTKRKQSYRVICAKDTSAIIGIIYLTSYITKDHGVIGYALDDRWRGKGFATEAVKAVLTLGFSRGFKFMCAEVLQENSASQRVLQKCGFENPTKWIKEQGHAFSLGWFNLKKEDFACNKTGDFYTCITEESDDMDTSDETLHYLSLSSFFNMQTCRTWVLPVIILSLASAYAWFTPNKTECD